ncbi:MAG: DUF3871 family protein [Fibrobacter sp.]|nr:DUF3871 family protein [Fibrobacter sp.]
MNTTENNVSVLMPVSQTAPSTTPPDSPPKRSPFITANSEELTKEILAKDIVPVFSKSNDTAISTTQFIESCESAMQDFFIGEQVDPAIIRGSHIIKGKKLEYITVPKNQLTENMITHYYERVIFAIEVPTIYEDVNNNRLVLSLVGLKNYGLDNLRGNLSKQHFTIAISLKNTICENGCIFSENIKHILATSPNEIYQGVMELLNIYDLQRQVNTLKDLSNAWMSREQFIYLLGSMKYYNYLPLNQQREITPDPILITDSQWNNVARQYNMKDGPFKSDENGIDMWKFYNLITGSNKNIYIHSYLERAANASLIATQLSKALLGQPSAYSWFLPN